MTRETCKAEGCGKPMRLEYPGNEPDNGPAQLFCPDRHSRCMECDAPCGNAEIGSDLCDKCWGRRGFFGQGIGDCGYPSVRPRPPGMEWEIRRSLTGPDHDPYGQTEYVVRLGTLTVRLTECALAGTSLDANDTAVITDAHFEWAVSLAELWFEALTGVTAYDMEAWDALAFEENADIRDAELDAGWDSSP